MIFLLLLAWHIYDVFFMRLFSFMFFSKLFSIQIETWNLSLMWLTFVALWQRWLSVTAAEIWIIALEYSSAFSLSASDGYLVLEQPCKTENQVSFASLLFLLAGWPSDQWLLIYTFPLYTRQRLGSKSVVEGEVLPANQMVWWVKGTCE